jgi:cytochrome P450
MFELCYSIQPFPMAPRKSLGLFLENGHQWRNSRTVLTPAFSAGKLKQMFHIMETSTDALINNMEKECDKGRPFDIYQQFQCLTLDVIGRCAFGLQTNAQTDPNDPFLANIRFLFNGMATSIILPLCSKHAYIIFVTYSTPTSVYILYHYLVV